LTTAAKGTMELIIKAKEGSDLQDACLMGYSNKLLWAGDKKLCYSSDRESRRDCP
jgi:hypothetical protein